MALADVLVIWLHLACASIWVGGSLFLGIVLAPMLGTIAKSPVDRLSLMLRVGRRFNMFALPAFAILIITGIYNSRVFLFQPNALVDTNYGIILLIKIFVVIITLIFYLIHIRSINIETENRIKHGGYDNIYFQAIRARIILLGRVIVGLSLIILFLGALLDSGGL